MIFGSYWKDGLFFLAMQLGGLGIGTAIGLFMIKCFHLRG